MRHLWILASVGAIALAIGGCTSEKPATSSNGNLSDNSTSNSRMGESDTSMLEADAKDALNSLLFDEKTRFLEKQTFSTPKPDTKLELTNSIVPENKNYKYAFAPLSAKDLSTKGKGIAISAISKQPGFRSFTGVVFVLESASGPLTVSQICETVKPSQLAPEAPAMPSFASEKIVCPTGSRSSLEIAALQ